MGSGNIVHSFEEVDFDDAAEALPWAIDFDALVAAKIDASDIETLAGYGGPDAASRRAFRTNEHYLPMLYILALREEGESLRHFHASIQNASMSMRCFTVGG
jgi:4,5-DOPA dioxygenase extradiol